MSYIAGLLVAASLGYGIGLARGRRRERRAQILQGRLESAIASGAQLPGGADPAPGPRPAQASRPVWHLERQA
ncbi:MAG TPA: hypothetical protein VGM87_25605 [Roseomonas sp.]|jgi:hypothetical protein